MGETHLRQCRQTSKLGLIKVVGDLFPGESLETAYSIHDGVFCKLVDSLLSQREVRQIELKLREWVAKDSPIQYLYHQDGYYQYQLEEQVIRTVYPAHPRASMVEPFKMYPFAGGFIIDFSDPEKGGPPFILPEKLAETYAKSHLWLDNINMEVVADVNNYIAGGHSSELISISEALQEKEIADIADMVLQQRRAIRLVLISGPSSSGKTTFARRLSTQLRVNGLIPVPLSLDDYFVNRDQTPLDKDGQPDYEALEALELDLLQRQIAQLINGETVNVPIFDFISGRRLDRRRTLTLGHSEILVIEGIHALNPNLLPAINRNQLFKVYISALFELNVDRINRIPTTEARLIRRMVRGDLFRGTHPEETFKQWPMVRRGESSHVFKYQEECDVMFNSSLLYELNALRPFAEAALAKVQPDSPYQDTKERLLNLLSFLHPLDSAKVPFNSLLREFIGGSIYTE